MGARREEKVAGGVTCRPAAATGNLDVWRNAPIRRDDRCAVTGGFALYEIDTASP